jgi:hypothetical protein
MRCKFPAFLAFALLLVGPAIRAEVPALVVKPLIGGKVSILVPDSFKPMTPEQLLEKYTRPNPPSLVYANEPANVSIAIDHTSFQVKADQLPEALSQMKAGMQQQIPNATWFRSELTKINGRNFALMELRTPSADGEVRNIMAATSLEDRLMIVSFNVTTALEAEWLPTGNKIIQSIVIK